MKWTSIYIYMTLVDVDPKNKMIASVSSENHTEWTLQTLTKTTDCHESALNLNRTGSLIIGKGSCMNQFIDLLATVENLDGGEVVMR
jgi:hypothetical protein